MEHIKELINKYYSTVPLYIEISEFYHIKKINSINDTPIINKNDFINNQSKCINPEYSKKLLNNELLISRTSGSTGSYLQIMWDKSDIKCSLVELWKKRVKYYNIYPHNRLLYFFTDGKNNEKYRQGENELAINKIMLLPNNIEETYNIILKWNPEWMILQPEMAVLLYMYIKHNRKDKPNNLKYIEFTGEMLEDKVRRITEITFNCTIANQYGANEVGTIAYECPKRKMHIMKSNVFIEIVNDEGAVLANSINGNYTADKGIGRIILTSYTNRAMPFIRYDIGDMGYISNEVCDCGCKAPILVLCGGRNNDFIFTEGGERISSYIFVELVDRVNDITNGSILQFYIEQNDYNYFTIRLYIDDEMDKEYLSRFINLFFKENYPYNAEFKIEFVKSFMKLGINGKYTYFKNNINIEHTERRRKV